MDTLGGMTRTGEKVAGPASDLVELESDKGLKHLAITFHRKYRQHDSLHAELRESMAFLEQPDVCDLVGLKEFVPESGAFIYPTGNVISVAEILEVLAKMGESGGVKAGLELSYLVAQVLLEASEKGERYGVLTHGDLSPWRILCRSDGQVKLIGYGLPQVDMRTYLEDPRAVPKEDAFRYCPPERLADEAESGVSDVFSLALIAFEVMVGEPLYNGLLAEIKQQATNAQGPYRLYQWRERLPESVVDLLTRALKFDMDSRHADINEFVWDVRDVLALPEVDGPTLTEVVGKVLHRLRRKRPLQGGTTDSMTPEELAAIADELDGPRKRALPDPKTPRPGTDEEPEEVQRWGSVSRSGSRDSARSGSGAERSGRDRLKDRLKRSGDARGGSSDARGSLRDRLKRSRNRDEPPSRSGRTSERDGKRDRSSRSTEAEEAKSRTKRSSSLLDRLRSSRDSAAASPEPAPAAEARTIAVSIEGAAPTDVAVADGDLVCTLIHRALAPRGGAPASLTGVVEGWYRAEQDGEDRSGHEPVADLDDATVDLVFEEASLKMVTVEVRGDGGVTLRTPVHTGLTAGAVLDQIRTTLELDGGGWQISVEGQALPPLLAIGEAIGPVGGSNDVTLVVET